MQFIVLLLSFFLTTVSRASTLSNDDIQQRLKDMEFRLVNNEKQIIQQQEQQRKEKATIKNLQEIIETQQDEITRLGQQKHIVHPMKHITKRQGTPVVGFTAYLDHSVSLGRGQTIVYNKAISNEGSAYNVHTGIFTCPYPGLYMFSFTVGVRNHEQVWAHLVVNSNDEVDGVADGFHDYHDVQGGGTVVLYLHKGDVVYIQTFSDDTYGVDSTYSSRFNSFAGALLHLAD